MPQILPVPLALDGAPREPIAIDRLIAGQPSQAVANAYSSPDARFHCGVWEADAGTWRVSYTEHEFCHLVAGRLRLRGDDGEETVWEAGQSFVVPAGFTGTWEVIEPARKFYAIYEPGD